MPAIVEECKESKACSAAAQHFGHCEENVNAGKGFPHEDCIEELCVIFLTFCCSTILT